MTTVWWIWQHLEHKSFLLINIITGYETWLDEFVIKQLKCKIVVIDRKLSIVRAPCWRICPILTIQFFIWSPEYMFGLLPNFLLIIIFWKTHYHSAVSLQWMQSKLNFTDSNRSYKKCSLFLCQHETYKLHVHYLFQHNDLVHCLVWHFSIEALSNQRL